ncbi:hypothetical protein BH11MYX4_BH11MYX4_45420 [soil metagenome]
MEDLRPWVELGRQLKLSAAVVSESSMLGWSFASFRRELAEPVTPDPKATPWLHGTWNGVATLVRVARMELPPLEVSAFHKTFDHIWPPKREGMFTMAVAEIAPPLFAGVRMATFNTWRFGKPQHESFVRLEPVRLHRAFWSYASNLPRLRRILDPRGPTDDFPDLLAAAAERVCIAIQDGVVEVFLPGRVTDAGLVSRELDLAVTIAKELARRSAELPEEPAVARAKSAWADVIASRGLQFDPACWHGFGRVDGTPVEILLEPMETYVRTTVRAAFPAPLGAALQVARQTNTSFLGLFAQSPPASTGEPQFDSTFAVAALDAPRARGILGEAVRARMLSAVSGSTHLLMNDAEVLLTEPRCSAPNELAKLIDDAVAIVAATTVAHRQTPPYR